LEKKKEKKCKTKKKRENKEKNKYVGKANLYQAYHHDRLQNQSSLFDIHNIIITMWKKQKGYVGNAKKTKGCVGKATVLSPRVLEFF
jgi:hypothetical protein